MNIVRSTAFVTLFTLAICTGRQAPGQITIYNTKLDGFPAWGQIASGNRIAPSVREATIDRNGDGDLKDQVVYVHDAITRITTPTGLAGQPVGWLDTGVFVFRVSENSQNADLNGNGNKTDVLMHLYDGNSGTIANLRLVTVGGLVFGNRVAYVVSEHSSGIDVNGDGDTDDTVLQIRDVVTGVVTNLPFAVDPIGMVASGDLVGFRVRETVHGDLNADGDTNDTVLHVYDMRTEISTNLGRTGFFDHLDGDLVSFRVTERDQGVDLNGDGDKSDLVLHVYNASSGAVTNLGNTSHLELGGGFGWMYVDEVERGKDLNGDGDATDRRVLHTYDPTTGVVTNTGVAGSGAERTGDLLVFLVPEWEQQRDLNGDGDQTDSVIHVHDLRSKVTSNTGLSSGIVALDGHLLLAYVFEPHAGVDANGDGDMADHVALMYDLASGAITNLGLSLAVSVGGSASQGRFLFAVDEAKNGGTDLNGDGDTLDHVAWIFDSNSGLSVNTGLACRSLALTGDRAWIAVMETSQFGADLDGNSTTTGSPIHHFRPSRFADSAIDQLDELVSYIERLNLGNNIANNLDRKIEAARRALTDMNENNDDAAIRSLEGLIDATRLQIGTVFSAADASSVISNTLAIISVLKS